ncbi:MAG: hypothetical protein IJM54_03970 [Thermoguttaceae bacterium]|nr:hypothetical protein [Thermoguttaceae bacterium]
MGLDIKIALLTLFFTVIGTLLATFETMTKFFRKQTFLMRQKPNIREYFKKMAMVAPYEIKIAKTEDNHQWHCCVVIGECNKEECHPTVFEWTLLYNALLDAEKLGVVRYKTGTRDEKSLANHPVFVFEATSYLLNSYNRKKMFF